MNDLQILKLAILVALILGMVIANIMATINLNLRLKDCEDRVELLRRKVDGRNNEPIH